MGIADGPPPAVRRILGSLRRGLLPGRSAATTVSDNNKNQRQAMLLKMSKPTAPQWVGFGLLWLGGIATLRWMLVLPGLRQLIPGFSELGLVAPAMFLASGAACVLLGAAPTASGVLSRWRRRAVWACAFLLVVFPSLMLIEYLAGASLGVDFVRDGFGAGPDVVFPGRMSPNACIAFGLAGLAACLLLQPATAVRRKTLLALVVGIAVIGAAGCIGYTLRFERLYRLAGANALSLPVAYGLTLLSAGLWLLRERWVVDASAGFHGHEQRISQRSIAVLAVVAIAAGVSGFAVIQETFEKSQADGMLLTATDNADALAGVLDAAAWLPRTLATRPAVSMAFNILKSRTGDAQQAEILRAAGQGFLNAGLRGIRFENGAGELLAGVGQLTVKPAALSLPLAPEASGRRLAWNDGYVLVTSQPVFEQGRPVGRIVTEQDLPLFDKLVSNVRWAGDSSDALVCRSDGVAASCIPWRMPSAAFSLPLDAVDQRVGLPVNLALKAEPGVTVARDPKGVQTVAAYTPIGPTGLVLLVKTNADTLYAPLRDRVNTLAAALVVLVAFGWWALGSQVRPLVAQMAAEERRTREILENSNDAFIAVDAEGLVTDWNSEAQRTFGWSRAEALGQKVSQLIVPPDRRAAHDEGFASFRGAGTGPVLNRRLEVSAMHRDGRVFMVELSVASLQEGGKKGYTAHAFVRDITERLAAQTEIANSEKHLRDITDNLPVLIGYIDSGRRLGFANRMFEHWLGLEPAALVGQPIASLGTPIYADRADLVAASLAGERVEYESVCGANGESRTLHTVLVPDVQPDGRVAGVYALSTDVSANKAVEQHLNQLARVDALTGLPNRRQFEERLDQAMARCRRSKRPMALIFMDIDHFKGINDSLGHGVGDAVLREVAVRLEGGVRITDLAARLAGDEFVVIAEGLNTVEEASLIAAKLVEAIRRPMVVKGRPLHVTTSMGLAYYTGHEGSAEDLTTRADRALYRAKGAGRDTFAATVF